MPNVKITRRGFRGRPESHREQAERIVAQHAADPDFPVSSVLAELRPTAYIGQANTGTSTLSVHVARVAGGVDFYLTTVA